jgi:hypothetical protein
MRIDSEQHDKAREALFAAVGKWDMPARRHQILFKQPDQSWAGYVTKECWKAWPFLRGYTEGIGAPPRYRVSFPGPVITATGDVKKIAAANYAKEAHELAKLTRAKSRIR